MFDTLELEHALIGAVCREQGIIKTLASIIRPEDFSIAACAEVYEAALDADSRGKLFDGFMAADVLTGKIDSPRNFIAECIECCPTVANAEVYAQTIRKHADDRRLREAISEALVGDDHDLAATVASICAEQIQARPMSHTQRLSDALQATYTELWNGDRLRIDTGYGKLDYLLKGFRAGEFVLVGARPSAGKSAFGLSIAEAAARHGHSVALFSLEMLADEVSERMIARHTEAATLDNLIDRPLPEALGEDVARAMCAASELPITVIDSPHMTVSRMRAQVLAMPKLSLIVVDYIGLMQSDRRYDSRYLELSEISRGLKNLAVELRVPVVALAQLNRARDDTERPTLRDLRDSGSLEQDANKVLLLWNIDVAVHTVGCSVAKNRRGRTGIVQFAFDGDHMRFFEIVAEYKEPPHRRAWDGDAR